MENECFENRELSWLRFNERVLEEAEDARVPLCERLSFLSIFQSNLDEFFMVRIGSLHDQMLLDKDSRENKTNMTPGEQIDAALAQVRLLCHRRDAAYTALMGLLAEQGVTIVDFHSIRPESEKYLETMFRREFLPLLSTFIIGKKQSFPFLANKDIYAIAVLNTKTEKKKIGIVPCVSGLFPRLIPVPERTGCYILAEELILHCLPMMFPGYKITSKTLARITRNADIDADNIYDEELNYRDHMAEVIKLRRKLCPVRMELSRAIDIEVIETLCRQLKLDTKRVYGDHVPPGVPAPAVHVYHRQKAVLPLFGKQGHLRHRRAEHQNREKENRHCSLRQRVIPPSDSRAGADRVLHSGRRADSALPAHDVPGLQNHQQNAGAHHPQRGHRRRQYLR